MKPIDSKSLPEPIPSATVIVLRERAGELEVLMLRRSAALAVHGGGWVFPGGRLDAADADARDALAALRNAAAREAREEASVSLAPDSLVYWSRWITPVVRVPRFDTWFFATAVDPGVEVTVDGGEIEDFAWLTPRAALAAATANRMDLMPPTVVTLLDLELCYQDALTVRRMLAAAALRPPFPITPRIVQRGDEPISLYPWDAEYASGAEGPPGPADIPAHLRRLPSRLSLRQTVVRSGV